MLKHLSLESRGLAFMFDTIEERFFKEMSEDENNDCNKLLREKIRALDGTVRLVVGFVLDNPTDPEKPQYIKELQSIYQDFKHCSISKVADKTTRRLICASMDKIRLIDGRKI